MTNQGIATAAARLVARAALEDLHLDVIRTYTAVDHTQSRRVAEKIGAVLLMIKPEEDGIFCAVYELRLERYMLINLIRDTY